MEEQAPQGEGRKEGRKEGMTPYDANNGGISTRQTPPCHRDDRFTRNRWQIDITERKDRQISFKQCAAQRGLHWHSGSCTSPTLSWQSSPFFAAHCLKEIKRPFQIRMSICYLLRVNQFSRCLSLPLKLRTALDMRNCISSI